MLQITDKGLTIDRLDEIVERYSQNMRSIYGDDIYIVPDSPDGQIIGIHSQELADLNEILAGMYANSDPYTAVGAWLDIQVKYVGISRNRETYSYLPNVRLNVVSGTVIPQGYTVTDENGVEWQTTAGATATGAVLTMQFRSSEYGAFHLGADKELNPKTVVLGVQQVLNTSESLKGQLRETDVSLLRRFIRSYMLNAYGSQESVEAVLLSLPDVVDAKVYENYTSTTDLKGVAPHSINAIIIGGDDEEIALAIARKKSLGCGLQGENSVTIFYDKLDRVINFDRATIVDINVKVTVVRNSAVVDVDVDTIKQNIADSKFLIGEKVIAGPLYYTASGDKYVVKEVLLNTDQIVIDVGLRNYARILVDNIEVVVE